MKPKRRRLIYLLGGMMMLGGAAVLVLSALEDGIAYFYSPSDLQVKSVTQGQHIRIGGLVEEGSIVHQDDGAVAFRVTDLRHTIEVSYQGILPDLFREGQGIVASGTLDEDGGFRASEVLAKHDETYMPSEVAEALKKSGVWREGEQP